MRILIILLATLIIACKPDSAGTANQKDSTTVQTTTDANPAKPASQGNIAQKGTQAMSTAQDGTQTLSEKERLAANGSKRKSKRATQKTADGQATNYNKNGIPDACDLISPKTIAKYLSISEASISLADGSSKKSDLQRACFFKWDDPNMRNAGVMVQVQQNPVADDVPEYFTFMVESLKSQGETDMTGLNMKYKDWPGHGDDAAYSTEAGKYVWRIGSDWAFMVAFNATLDAKKQKAAAEAFAKEIMSKMVL